MYNQIFTTQIAIQGQTSILIANLTNIEHKPVVGDILYGSDAYYAQITRVGESVVEFTVIGLMPTVIGTEGPQGPIGPKGDKGDKGDIGPSVPVIDVLTSTSKTDALSANQGKVLQDTKASKVQEAWITPTLLNGATGTVQYRKNQFGRLEFNGILTGVSGMESFVLVSEYRPTTEKRMMVVEQNASVMQSILVSSAGRMFVTSVAANKALQMSSTSLILD